MITLKRFRRLETILRHHGYGEVIDWSESIQPPASAAAFAEEVIYVICNSGMAVTVGAPLARRCIARLNEGGSAAEVFAHPGKRRAIDEIWRDRAEHFACFQHSSEKLEFLQSLPWIGPVTRYHLAKNLGADVAKPDVHIWSGWHDETKPRRELYASDWLGKRGIELRPLTRFCGELAPTACSKAACTKPKGGGRPSGRRPTTLN